MILAIVKGNRINKLTLPDVAEGSYIVTDSKKIVIGTIYAEEDKWLFEANDEYYIEGSKSRIGFVVEKNTEIIIKDLKEQTNIYMYLYMPNEANAIKQLVKTNNILIGKTGEISYERLDGDTAKIYKINNIWYVESINNSLVYVNGRLIRRKKIEYGDIIFIYGLKIFLLSDFIIVQLFNSRSKVSFKYESFEKYQDVAQEIKEESLLAEGNYETYSFDDEYLRSPRFRSSIRPEKVVITPPPQKQPENTQPAILTIGPRLTMMLTSVISLITLCNNIATGRATLKSSMLSIIVMVVTMTSTILWPSLSRKWAKHERKRNELKRLKTYREYLKKKDKEISNIVELQKQILLENNITLNECQEIIYNKKRNLWEKIISDDDFLTVRLGIGKVKPEIEIGWQESDFAIDDDKLKEELKAMIKKYEYMDEMPLNMSLAKNRITAMIGNYALVYSLMQSLLLQLVTFHPYSELKIVIFTNEDKIADWNYLKFLPHCWDNTHERRLIASTPEEGKKLSQYLEGVFYERGMPEEPDGYKYFNTYYLVIVDNIDEARNFGIVNAILNSPANNGFSLLIKNDRIANLPRACTTFINVTEELSGVFETYLIEENQKQFKADFNRSVNVEDCFKEISNIFIEVPKERYELPKSIGFMEMYGVGNVNQFNSNVRWKVNNPVVSLGVPVGIDQSGNLFYMDIHEKAFGPHGLVAGTTGSGKSEWLITYILSLALNYSPLELQFVLIDYKGGGLAGSFENTETGMELPHLVGTITNLDKSEIRRSIASLESESKRRQKIFNEARDKLDDSSMDIYKYQEYYRKGLVDEPLSHLLIISDEFAELKSQEPEFLDSLVSIARVGRSLGIHLILATQKPGGIVTDQIWSNSRFKICLRVQDKADSNDMIKKPDAAYLKQTGAFYLQVGMDEVFALGQSAYSGLKYQPTNIVKKKIDTAVEEMELDGTIVSSHSIIEKKEDNSGAHGEELLNIIKYLDDVAEKQDIVAKKLWLTPISEFIYIDKLRKKYNFKREPFNVKPILGEYDDPVGQKQDQFVLDLLSSSMFIYGVSGSGKEKLLQTIIYSTMVSYSPKEAVFYLCDFGGETLTMFEGSPHVGGVVLSSDMTKFNNLLKMVAKEYNDRKAKYREFGGNYESNNKYGKEKDPMMVIIINGFEFIKEEYDDYRIFVEKIMMDSHKYGIVFIISSIDKSALRYKVIQSLNNVIVMRVNDSAEYRDFFGVEAKGMEPKKLKGRGLFKRDGSVYEFQAGTITDEEELQPKLKLLCEKINQYYKEKARPIPMIPDPITLENADNNKVNINNLFVGYSKKTLDKLYINLQKNIATLISASKKNNLFDFSKLFLTQIDNLNDNMNVYLFDPVDTYKSESFKRIKYFKKDNYKENLLSLIDTIKKDYEVYKSSSDKANFNPTFRCTIILESVTKINSDLTPEEKTLVENLIEYATSLNSVSIVYIDNQNEIKTYYRESIIAKMLSLGNGILLDNSGDNQMFMDVSTKDIRPKTSLLDNEAFVVTNNRAVYAQVLRTEKVSGDDNEI